jgi:hypothetical protein
VQRVDERANDLVPSELHSAGANMVATRAVKRALADSQNPLMHKGILQLVLDLVGPGHPSRWRGTARGF